MPRRRGKGGGSVYEDKKRGLWVGRVFVGFDAQGKRVNKTVYGKTRREVETKVAELVTQQAKGMLVKPEKVTLDDYLDRWLAYVKPSVRPATHRGYEDALEHARRHLGKVEIGKLNPLAVQEFYSRLREETYRRGHTVRRYGERTVQLVHAVLREALQQAVKWRLIHENPVQHVEAPRPKKYRPNLLPPERMAEFLEKIKDDPWYPVFFTALATGMRRGELAGLRWPFVDLQRGTITVQETRIVVRKVTTGEPKSGYGERTFKIGEDLVEMLRVHKARQERLARELGEEWKGSDYVFTNRRGEPYYPTSIYTALQRLLTKHGFERIRLHDLRYSYVSMARRAGVPLEVVSRRVGHHSPAFTANQYRVLFADEDAAAAIPVREMVSASIPRPEPTS